MEALNRLLDELVETHLTLSAKFEDVRVIHSDSLTKISSCVLMLHKSSIVTLIKPYPFKSSHFFIINQCKFHWIICFWLWCCTYQCTVLTCFTHFSQTGLSYGHCFVMKLKDTEFVQDVEVSAQRQRKMLKYSHKECSVTGRHWHACAMDYATTFTNILLSRLLNVMGYIPQWIALKIESKLFAEALQP